MKIRYCCTYWGCEHLKPDEFVDKALSAGYEGIEIHLPSATGAFAEILTGKLDKVMSVDPEFTFIAQHLTVPDNDTVDDYISRMEKNIRDLAALRPAFINSHTGRDHYSFDDNCKVLEATLNISRKTGVRILHETHRGRFSFHAASLIPYLKVFPELELVGDFSHFCTVSESLLQDQQDILMQVIPHVAHVHARVGYEQSPQVNAPFAPEWNDHLTLFKKWWQQVILSHEEKGGKQLTMTPEFGPAPYMPSMPFTQEPLADQWETNHRMMQHLKATFQT